MSNHTPIIGFVRVMYHAARYWYYSKALQHMHPIHRDYMHVNQKVIESSRVIQGK